MDALVQTNVKRIIKNCKNLSVLEQGLANMIFRGPFQPQPFCDSVIILQIPSSCVSQNVSWYIHGLSGDEQVNIHIDKSIW